ncbi:MAG: flippase-like domain-containing protein [Actinobacteria bacterium]|nr:flippase-like domain-containing protein [Actinomycetota bacterium]
MSKRARSKIFSALRILIALGLLAFLIKTQLKDFSKAIQIIKSGDIPLLILSFSMHFFGILITTIRWNILLRTQKIIYSNSFLLSSILIGFFFNNFLPTSIGGDIYRIYDTSKAQNSSVPKSTSVIIIERLIGVASATIYLVAALFLGFTQIQVNSIATPIIILFVVSTLLLIVLLFPEKFKLNLLLDKMRFLHRFSDKLKQMYDTFISFKKYKITMVETLFLSLALQFCVILNYYFCARAFGINLALISFLFIVPVVATISMIPISIGGIGVRENSLVFLMVSLGASNQKSAIVSLVLFLMLLIPGIAGGIIYAVRPYIGRKTKTSE